MRFPSTLYLIFALAVALRQLPDDDIRTAGHIKRTPKKYGVADFEFVDGNDGTSLDESNDKQFGCRGDYNAANSLMPPRLLPTPAEQII